MEPHSTSSSHTPASYRQLPEGSFRLIQLLPGSWNDTLNTELLEPIAYLRPGNQYTAELSNLDGQTPNYVALSYTWGNCRTPRTITINGVTQWITTNLDLALRTLRAEQQQKPVTIWVDALCIDQNDDMERSRQVSLMHQIFQQAAYVHAYVGDPFDRGLGYEQHLKELGSSDPFQFSTETDKA
ncbi:heterokaryon incompatibility protein-domain-containing protein [Fusarium redolens]|jgi:hypothetical protein|uniref:Heterokaryon incompatibility protein-domain-containing protein n=1 Tax=Fusarium redolens TaxID=48865 RepID=A0A9P9H451_FUSRE|nr:heterokaryon incompatibility protein-domain-containing protein [Fusarium redolens]KAH7250040.1 heterokaryon incompatibility protein-domain-containing protein [Fusarium redolens]